MQKKTILSTANPDFPIFCCACLVHLKQYHVKSRHHPAGVLLGGKNTLIEGKGRWVWSWGLCALLSLWVFPVFLFFFYFSQTLTPHPVTCTGMYKGELSPRLSFKEKNSSMELTWFAPQTQKSQAREIGTLPNHKEAILINFLAGA